MSVLSSGGWEKDEIRVKTYQREEVEEKEEEREGRKREKDQRKRVK